MSEESKHDDPYNLHDDFNACPFCGSTHIHHESIGGSRYARCEDCSATGGHVFDFQPAPFTREEVVSRWNSRLAQLPNKVRNSRKLQAISNAASCCVTALNEVAPDESGNLSIFNVLRFAQGYANKRGWSLLTSKNFEDVLGKLLSLGGS